MKPTHLVLPAALIALAALPALPLGAAEQCSTLGLSCATAYGYGYYAPYSCPSGDSFSHRTCSISWSWQGSGRGAGIGVVNVVFSSSWPTTYSTSRQCTFTGGACAVSQQQTSLSYYLDCNAHWEYADVTTTTTTDGVLTAREDQPLSAYIPACTA